MSETAKPELRVTVFSDYTCAFCYVGYVRLERLRAEYDLKVNWCMIELHPETPESGRPVSELGYSPERWSEMMTALQILARDEQIVILPQTYTANTHRALLLAEAAKEAGRDVFYALHRRLFEAYFGEARNLGDVKVLRELAAATGVSDEIVARAWADPQYPARLQQNLMAAQELEITATPTYFIGERKLTGALSLDTLRYAAREASVAAQQVGA
ncbi:MAG: DsbA family oxidoreductase [Gammaproteobacteria bacterium]